MTLSVLQRIGCVVKENFHSLGRESVKRRLGVGAGVGAGVAVGVSFFFSFFCDLFSLEIDSFWSKKYLLGYNEKPV